MTRLVIGIPKWAITAMQNSNIQLTDELETMVTKLHWDTVTCEQQLYSIQNTLRLFQQVMPYMTKQEIIQFTRLLYK